MAYCVLQTYSNFSQTNVTS